jgi:hypothetical protein
MEPSTMKPLFAVAIAILLSLSPLAGAADDEAQIRDLLSTTFDRPDAKVVADPIAVAGAYAIAGWTQADKGGRALLKREHGQWALLACAGDDFKQALHLEHAGIPRADAKKLAALQASAESRLPRERLELFGTFGPMVGSEAHGAGSHGGHGKP